MNKPVILPNDYFQSKALNREKKEGENSISRGGGRAIERKAKIKFVQKLTHKMIHKHFLDILFKKTPLTEVETCLAKIPHSIIMINALLPNICSCGIWTR